MSWQVFFRPGAVLALLAGVCILFALSSCKNRSEDPMSTPNKKIESPLGTMPALNDEEQRVILHKGTEMPGQTSKYWKTTAKGVYVCRQCGAPLYLSDSKFPSECGWPSFDDAIPGAVKRQMDADGSRTEILCANCGGHLGHVFVGEELTPKDTRHCVNSVSMVFVPEDKWPLERAIFAGGCFWGVEHLFRDVKGVIAVRSGYTGGHVDKPTYKQVCTDKTGHAEAVEILFDPAKVTYEALARRFFEIHDPTQLNFQGPDYGRQYRSAVFYTTPQQKATAEKLIGILKGKGYKVVTEVTPASTFWAAEDYHQDYFAKHPERAVCHEPVERFK